MFREVQVADVARRPCSDFSHVGAL